MLGQEKQGLVTVEAVKKFGSLHFNLITVDPIEADGTIDVDTPIVIAGNEDRLYVREQLNSMVFLRKNLQDGGELPTRT